MKQKKHTNKRRIWNKINNPIDSHHAIALHLYMDKRLIAFERLLTIMDELREQCPWDQKQTMESLRHLTIEETYEMADAITDKDYPGLEGELGDLFLHLVFYSKIGSEQGLFDVESVLNKICDKLIYRHPHIYGDVEVNNDDDVKRNWEQIKLKEGNKSVLGGVPGGLPALVKASRIQEKARGVGFDWDKKEQVWAKVEEELQEFKDEFNIAENENIDTFDKSVAYKTVYGITPFRTRKKQKYFVCYSNIKPWV